MLITKTRTFLAIQNVIIIKGKRALLDPLPRSLSTWHMMLDLNPRLETGQKKRNWIQGYINFLIVVRKECSYSSSPRPQYSLTATTEGLRTVNT